MNLMLASRAYHPFRNMSALKLAALANLVTIVVAELIAVTTWYSMYGVFGPAVLITAAITFIASALPLITVVIYMIKKQETTTRELVYSKAKLKTLAASVLNEKERQLTVTAGQLSKAIDDVVSANHAKSHCLGLMSHELRTPLNTIIGYAEAMQKETFGPIGNVKYREYADDIHTSGSYLLAVAEVILELYYIETGNNKLSEDRVEIAELLQEVDALVRDVADGYDIHLRFAIADDVAAIWADAVKLKQILIHLITNAIKYSAPGSECGVEVRLGLAGRIEFAVVDSGVGVAVQDLPQKLPQSGPDAGPMDPYMRTSTGLGLPLCQALAEMHGGALLMAQEPDRGSRVTVILPATRVIQTMANQPALSVVG